MTLSQKAVEAAAEEIDPDLWETDDYGAFVRGTATIRKASRGIAERAITAALTVDGLCLVPMEPTEAMIEAGDDLARRYFKAPPVDLYKAMLAAASDGEEG